MAPHRLYFIGTQLLFLSLVANSFILLTANMEDVKKIARKFVSDSLADRIAEFVAKASNQMIANVSEENDEILEDIQNISDENQLQNITRQRPEKVSKTSQRGEKEYKKYEDFVKEYKKEETKPEVQDISNTGQVINWEKEVNEMVYDSKSKEVNDKSKNFEQPEVDYNKKLDENMIDNERAIQDDVQPKFNSKTPIQGYEDRIKQKISNKPKKGYKSSKLDFQWPKVKYEQQEPDQRGSEPVHQKPDYKHQKSYYQQPESNYEKPKTVRKPKSHLLNQKSRIKELRNDEHQPGFELIVKPTVDHTIHNHKLLRNGSPNSNRPAHRGHKLTGFDSLETNQSSQPALQGFNIASLTTKKERTEFDQYDNPNYPKSEFIATSGPVALPKVPIMKPWWEKEMVTRNIN